VTPARPQFALIESNTTGSGRQFVSAARKLGLHPVLLAAEPARYDYVQAEQVEVVQVDTWDASVTRAACEALVARGPLAGIASSSEYFMEAAVELAHQLDLPGPRPEAVRACRHKGEQRRILAAAGVRVPEFVVARSAAAVQRALDVLGTPVVLKPLSGSGSLGVRLCADRCEAVAHAGTLLAIDRNERGLPVPTGVLLERFVDGPEFSAEVVAGTVVGLTRKHLGAPPWFVETGHDHPAELSAGRSAALEGEALKALAALDLADFAAHVELRLDASGPVLIEVNPRLAGGRITDLVRLARGIDLVAATVALHAGRVPALVPTRRRWSSIRFLVPGRTGLLATVGGVDAARRLTGVVQVEVRARTGDAVTVHHDFRDRLGHVVAEGATPAAARDAAEGARAAVTMSLAGDAA
jgi:biotin carboxylase